RRGEIDFIVDAVETAKAVGAPVKVVWTREDDITHGFYRPATYNVFRAALGANGMPEAWSTRVVGPGIQIQKGRAQAGTIDPAAVEAVRNMPYDIPNLRIEWNNKDLGIPLGFWRSVGPSQNGFIIESFVYALTAAFYGQITIDRGRVQQSNFNDYQMLRINEMPMVDVQILDSGEAPGGLGEPGVPTVAPAVTNAIFAATGKRIRKLHIDRNDLKRA